jgi:multiple sugar transport system permease protein
MRRPRAPGAAAGASRERRQAYLLVAPALALLAVVAAAPLAAAAWMSLERIILVFHERRFVGLANYRFLLGDLRFRAALGHTAYFTAVAVALEVGLALPLALLLDGAGRGKGLFRAAVLLPWVVPTAVSAQLWALLLAPGHGLVARLWPGGAPDLLATPARALHAAVLVDVWKTTPFVALLLLAGLQSIPEELYRAARVDGASRWRTFRSVTLPLLEPAILVAVLFRALDALRVFDAIFVLTGGGPANGTETLSIYAYKTLVRSGDFGYGSALAVAAFLCAAAVSAVWLAGMAWRSRRAAR